MNFSASLFTNICHAKKPEDFAVRENQLTYSSGLYNLINLRSSHFHDPRWQRVIITAGFHGEEIAGSFTLLFFLRELAAFAQAHRVALSLYPLCNPAGWEAGTRYNPDGKGPYGNNDFIRYELKDKIVVPELGAGGSFERWFLSLDTFPAPPQESVVISRMIQEDIAEASGEICGAIDLHQDYLTPDVAAAAYQYAYGDLMRYRNIVEQIETEIFILRNHLIGGGQSFPMRSDEQGFIVRHDGTLGDWMHRIGVPHVITVETTGATPIEIAIRVNLIWIWGIMQMIVQEKSMRGRRD